jgi:acyl-coenzyme A thioesterase PaaI-like protein
MVLDSPIHRLLGLEGEVEAREGRASFEVVVGRESINPYGRTHAAFYYTFLDVVCYCAALSVLPHDQSATTADMHSSLMSGTQVGDRVRFEGHILKRGRNLIFLTADATCDGKLVAQARITKFVLA